MPIYDYKCGECGKIFDIFHKVREVQEDILCPACGSMKHTRLLSAPSINMGSRPEAPPCATGGCCPGGSCGLN
jgi:putative FmdB family regulatory protein